METDKNNNKLFCENMNKEDIWDRKPLFEIFCFILQITTIFNSQYAENVTINNFYTVFLLFIILELIFCNQIFKYFITVIIKTVIFIIAYKCTGITANGFIAFPLMQISFLYYYFIKHFPGYRIIDILTFLFILLLCYITNNETTNQILYYSVFIFVILNLLSNYLRFMPIDKRFTIHIKTSTKFIEYLQSIKLPVSWLILLSLNYLFFIDNSFLLIKIIFTIFIVSPSLIELRAYLANRKKYSPKIKIPWSFLVVFISLVGIIYYISIINIPTDSYQRVINNTFSIIMAFAIFNITALFILLQINYHKFLSAYLIKTILKSPPLLIFTFTPTIILFLYSHLLNGNVKIDFIPLLFSVLCFFSSISLILYFRIVLETNVMLRKLLISVTDDDFDNYKENIIPMNEMNIDAVLGIIQAVIKKNDVPRAQSSFYSLSFWINENIDNIKYGSKFYYDELTNRFNTFFNTIHHELIMSNNIVMHNYYLQSIQQMIMPSITSDNYNNYKIIFISLHDYLIRRLEKQQDEYAKEIYRTIYSRCSFIFLSIKKNDSNQVESEGYDLFDFKQIFLEDKLRNIINTAMKNKCTAFLERIHILDDLFVSREIDNFHNHWDAKIQDTFLEIKFHIAEKNRYILENSDFFSSIKSDYNIFLKYPVSIGDAVEYECYNTIIKFILYELSRIYDYAISLDKKLYDFNFEIIWGECLGAMRHNDLDDFELFYSFFTFLLDKIFDKEYKKKMPNISLVYSLFNRVLQIKEIGEVEFMDIILSKYNILIEKYPGLVELENIFPKSEFIVDMDFLKKFEIKVQENNKSNKTDLSS